MQHTSSTSLWAWLPFFIVTLVTMVILFIIADVRLP